MSISNNKEKAKNTIAISTSWTRCQVCKKSFTFKNQKSFMEHLRNYHSKKEGGSFICQYSNNGVCGTLPIEGVNDNDYQIHIMKDHLKLPSDSNVDNQLSSNPKTVSTSITKQNIPNVVEDQKKWTIHHSKVNLPAALNDPRAGRRETEIFSKIWGPNFETAEIMPSTYLPNIKATHFTKYLKKTNQKYNSHLKFQSVSNNFKQDEDSVASLLNPKVKPVVDLEGIPPVFLKQNFNLENIEIFQEVFPWCQVTETSQFPGGARILQEKLTHYLDCIEVQIAKQISAKAESFFQAMSSHDKLQLDMKKTIQEIHFLRTKMKDLNTFFVEKPLKIMKSSYERNNHVSVLEKLRLMSTVHQTQPTIQVLLASNDFIGALDLIYTTREVLSQELRGIYSFRHLSSQLTELESLIEKMMEDEFLRMISNDLMKPLDEMEYIYECEHLTSVLLGMIKIGNYKWINVFESEASTAIKLLVKNIIVDAVSHLESDDVESGSLADQMRVLSYDPWMNLLDSILEKVLSILKRIKMINDIMKEVCKRKKFEISEELSNVSEVESLVEKINLSFFNIIESAHDRIGKLISARAKDGFINKLQPSGLVILWKKIDHWMTETKLLIIIERKIGITLSSCMKAQATAFISNVHDEKRMKLSLILDNEHWKQAEVPAQFQQLMDHVISTGSLSKNQNQENTNLLSSTKPYLVVNNEEFSVVGTVLMLFRIIVEYCELAEIISGTSTDILTRLFELLNMFNSRTCQLVLGAGAVQLIGLKTISTKHLALNSRCLQFIVFLLPLIHQHFERILTERNNNQLRHLEKITKDYKNHIEEIDNKLISIVENMFIDHFSNYEVKPPMPSQQVRKAVSDIGKFYAAINTLLSSKHILKLLLRVHEAFKNQIRFSLLKLKVSNDGSPKHGLVTTDLAYYSQQIRLIPPLQSADHNMESIWRQ